MLGVTCFIEASSIQHSGSVIERKREKGDPKELVEASKKQRMLHFKEAGMQLCCPYIAWFNEALAIDTASAEEKWASYTGKY